MIQLTVTADQHNACLVLHVEASERIVIKEIQGSKHMLEALDGTMPKGFQEKAFGDQANIPKEMALQMKMFNQQNFRWAGKVMVDAGQKATVVIPCHNLQTYTGYLEVLYATPKLLSFLEKTVCERIQFEI